jgi:uncharacterized protein YdaU (DUF1376 family)
MNYYQRHIGDYHKKAGRLSMLEHGAYTLLLDSCYDREKFPTKEEALDWCWARSPEEVAAVEFVLSKFFTLQSGVFVQATIADNVAAYHEKALKNKQIAIEREEARRLRREQGVHETARSVHESPPNHKPITNNQEPITISKDISKPQAARFTEPSVSEVCQYMNEIQKGSPQDAEKFCDFYSSKGWMVGKNKMKCWKAAVRNWTKSDNKPATRPMQVSNFSGQNYRDGDL